MKDVRIKIVVAALSGLVALALLVLHFKNQEPDNAKSEALFHEAEALLRQGKLYEAETKLDQAVKLSPEDVRYIVALADVLKSEGDYQGALKRYLLVAELNRDDPQPLFEAGILALQSGDRVEAEKIFADGLTRKPGDIPTLYQLGYLAMLRAQYDDAARYYQRIINDSAREPEAYRNLGFIHAQKDELDQAEEMYRKAIQYRPDDPELENDLGNLLVLRGKNDEARKAFARAIELKPDYHDAQVNLAALDHAPAPAPGSTAAPAPPPAPPPAHVPVLQPLPTLETGGTASPLP